MRLLLLLLGLTTVVALQTLGIVLVVAMLVAPGAIAYMLTDRFDRMLMLAVVSSVFSCVVGIYTSFYLNASTGGCIVFTQSLVFLMVLTLAPKRGLLTQALNRRTMRRSASAGSTAHAPAGTVEESRS